MKNFSFSLFKILFQNLNSSIFNSSQTSTESEHPRKSFTPPLIQNPPRPVEAPIVTTSTSTNYYSSSHVPLLPPPMPPFSKSEMEYGSTSSFNTYTSAPTTQYGKCLCFIQGVFNI